MSKRSPYVHALDGRLRIRVVGLKRSPTTARRIEERLRALDGVTSATANPRTGNVLVLYDPGRLSRPQITDVLQGLGVLPETAASAASSGLAADIASNLARLAMEAALQRAIIALL